jgi:Domain of unknown function (DUF4852)
VDSDLAKALQFALSTDAIKEPAMACFRRGVASMLCGLLTVCSPAIATLAGRPPQASTSFNAPEPDHLSLFRLYMAAHGEALAANDSVMWEHYLLFSVPVGAPPKGPSDQGSTSKECQELNRRLENEITRQSIVEEARAQFRKALASTGAWPQTMVFRLRIEANAATYDSTSASFPLAIVPTVRIQPRPSVMADGYIGPVQSWCPGGMRMGNVSRLWTSGFSLKVVGSETLARLPMTTAAAETFIESFSDSFRTGGRRVRLEAVVEVGPMPFNSNEAAPARIVAARALHPLTGAALHTFYIGSSGATSSATLAAPVAKSPVAGTPVARSEPPAAAASTPAPRPAAMSAPQHSAASFNAPEIDHLAMFNLYMAANADVLTTNEASAWERYLLFSVPKGPPFKDAIASGVPSKECSDLSRRLANEITRQSLLKEAQSQFRAALASAATGPKTGIFLLRTQERLGTYDLGSGTFPVEHGFSGASVTAPETSLGLKISRESACGQGYQSTRQNWCSASAGGAGFSGCTRPFSLQILGASALQRMPMERQAAEAFLNADAGGIRAITLETVVEVGPVPIRADDVAGYIAGKERIPARIVAARALDPKSGAVLHTFVIGAGTSPPAAASSAPTARVPPPAAPTGGTAAPRPAPAASEPGRPTAPQLPASPTTPRTDDTFPFTAYRGLLLTVRDQPEVLTDQALIDMAQGQVYAEQSAWKVVSNRVASGQPLNRLNPKRPAFTYEWQTLAETNPTLAGGPLLDTFLRTDADWSFVTSDPAWDERFAGATPVEVFLFTRDRIEGRDHRFAAQELGPAYGRHLRMAAAKAHTSLSLRLRMPPGAYDFQAKALRFLPQGASVGSGHPLAQNLDLLDSVEQYPEHYRPPQEASGRATYMLMGLSAELRRAEPASTKPGIAMQDAPTDAWRGRIAIGASSTPVPLVELLALDRRAQISTVPIDAARAEALVRRQPGLPAIDGFTATLFFEAERVVLGERMVARKPTRNAVLLARVKRVDVFDPDGKLITSFPADSLPPPTRAPSAPTAPARSSAPSKATTREEAARENQRIENEKMEQVSAEARRKAEAASKAAIAAAGGTPVSAPVKSPATTSGLPAPAKAAGGGIAGCWVYNTITLTIYDDGRITGFLDGGKWSLIGDNRFLITWPPSIDTLVLSPDGSALSGSNNYAGPAISGQRISGDPRGVAGTWKWPNGSTTVLSAGGEAQNGPVSGKWTQLRDNTIRIVWNFFFTDDVTLSADGQNLAGKNMLGTPVGGRRIPCSK